MLWSRRICGMFSLDAVLADTPVASLWAGVGLGAPDKENFAPAQKLFIGDAALTSY
jgi:hypothetical protein